MHSALAVQLCPFPRSVPEELLDVVALELLDVVPLLELLDVPALELLLPLLDEPTLELTDVELPVAPVPLELELAIIPPAPAAPPCALLDVPVLELDAIVPPAPPFSGAPVNVKCVVQAATPATPTRSPHTISRPLFIRTFPASRGILGPPRALPLPPAPCPWAPSRRG